MPQNRFFVSTELQKGNVVSLEGDELHHLHRVMRGRAGDEVEIINGKGALGLGVIQDTGKILLREVTYEKPAENRVTMALAHMKPASLEWAVEKLVELGVDQILFYPAARSEKKELSDAQRKRLQTIVISATKQCGRLFMPSLQFHQKLQDCLQGETILFGDLRPDAVPISKIQFQSVTMIVGTESGFTEQEIQSLLSSKAISVTLHKNILRAETAAIAAAALITSR